MRILKVRSCSLMLGLAGALSACTDSPTTTTPGGGTHSVPGTSSQQIAVIECSARPAAHSVTCDSAPSTGASADLILGGQGRFVALTSSNVAYDGAHFSFDATVQSLIPQPLATSDGVTADPGGVKVFFAAGPTVTSGTGSISVENPDGTGAFTAPNQPYFQYDGATLGADAILSKDEVSGVKTWTLNVDPTVTTFSFKVYVTAVVQHPEGYINLSADTAAYVLTDSGYTLPTQTYAFTAQRLSGAGLPVRSATITWTSSDPSIATVDGSGIVTGVAPGRVTISAQSDTLVSTATLSVCPNLAVGDVYITSGSGAADICLMSGGTTTEYAAVPLNGSTNSSASLTFTASGVQAVTGPPANLIPAGDLQIAGSAASVGDEVSLSKTTTSSAGAQLAFEKSLRRGLPSLASQRARGLRTLAANHRSAPTAPEQGVMTPNGSRTRLVWYVSKTTAVPNEKQVAAGGAAYTITPGVPTVGDLMNLDVQIACSGASDVRVGRVRTVTRHAIIVGDTANPAGGYTTAQFDSIGLEFDTIAYKVDSTNFGEPADADGNGRVVIFYTRAVNERFGPGASLTTYGYYAPKDLFSPDPVSGCSSSNAGEMIYMMVPDPTGAVNSNVRTVSSIRGNGSRELTHQLEHLINGSRRLYVTGANAFEEAWLDEGLASVATELAFYRTSFGLAPRGNIVLSNLNTGPNASRRVAAYNTYENILFTNLRAWMQRPDTTGPILHTLHSDVTGSGSLAATGALWAFLRYASDRVNGDDAAFWSSLVNSNLEGTANIQNAIGGADPFSWARDFAVALYADDNAFTMATPYTTPSWNYRSVYGGLGGFPLLTRPLSNGTPLTLSISYGGGTSYLRFGVPASGRGHLTTNSGGVDPASNIAMAIVRTK